MCVGGSSWQVDGFDFRLSSVISVRAGSWKEENESVDVGGSLLRS